jgi:hypothetical protein
VIFSIPINAVALIVCRRLGVRFEFSVATRLFAGTFTDATVSEIASEFQNNTVLTARTYIAILACSYLFGALMRRIVWTFRLDIHVPLLRLKHSWYYMLQGRLPDLSRRVLAYVDVLTEHPGEAPENSRLYRGLVVDFEISPTGGLDSLTLRDAKRGSGRRDDFKWKDIPSSRFMIVGSKIHSINVTYIELDEELPRTRWARLGYHARLLLRRFLFEEP